MGEEERDRVPSEARDFKFPSEEESEGDIINSPENTETEEANSLFKKYIAGKETSGTLYEIVQNNTDIQSIKEFFDDYVEHLKEKGITDAEKGVKMNIQYIFQEFGKLDGRKRVYTPEEEKAMSSWREAIPGLYKKDNQ